MSVPDRPRALFWAKYRGRVKRPPAEPDFMVSESDCV